MNAQRKLELAARRIAMPILDQVGAAAKKNDQAALKGLRSRIDAIGVRALISDFEAAVAAADSDPWIVLDLQSPASEIGATMSRQADGSVLADGKMSSTDSYTMSARVGLRQVRAFRLEAIPTRRSPPAVPAASRTATRPLRIQGPGGRDAARLLGRIGVVRAGSLSLFACLDGNPLTGWAVMGRQGQVSAAFFHLQAPADLETVTLLLDSKSKVVNHVLGCFRISVSLRELPAPPAPRPADAYNSKPDPVKVEVSPAAAAYRAKWSAAARLPPPAISPAPPSRSRRPARG